MKGIHCSLCVHCKYIPKGQTEMTLVCEKTAKHLKNGVTTYQSCADTRAKAGVTEACGPKAEWFESIVPHAHKILEELGEVANGLILRGN